MSWLGLTPDQHYNIFIAFLATIPAVITALAGLIVAWRTHQKVAQVEAHTNGMQKIIVASAEKGARDQERAVPTAPDAFNIPPTQERS